MNFGSSVFDQKFNKFSTHLYCIVRHSRKVWQAFQPVMVTLECNFYNGHTGSIWPEPTLIDYWNQTTRDIYVSKFRDVIWPRKNMLSSMKLWNLCFQMLYKKFMQKSVNMRIVFAFLVYLSSTCSFNRIFSVSLSPLDYQMKVFFFFLIRFILWVLNCACAINTHQGSWYFRDNKSQTLTKKQPVI